VARESNREYTVVRAMLVDHKGDAPGVAVCREVCEETGLTIVRDNIIEAYNSTGWDEKTRNVLRRHLYIGAIAMGSPEVRLSSEHDAWEFLRPEEAAQRFASTAWAEGIEFVLEHSLQDRLSVPQ
jgi:8-oxo-dGTP pyrophosphatase MutT (NUDIX family)